MDSFEFGRNIIRHLRGLAGGEMNNFAENGSGM